MDLRKSAIASQPASGQLAAIGTCLLAFGLFVLAFAAARAAGDWSVNLESNKFKLLLSSGLIAIAIAAIMLLFAYRRSRSDIRFGFQFPIIVSVLAILFCLGAGEAAIRMLAKPDLMGARVGATLLQPYEWRQVAEENMRLFEKGANAEAYSIVDPDLGWSIGPSRASQDGLYKSSVEGLRSRNVGDHYRGIPSGKAVALFGNSFAFSEEVSYEESLSHHLEGELGQGTPVLNFGVSGYGVDQALLRLRKERENWSPKIVILTFIQDDLLRTVNVYTFLKPEWKIPLSKPRFIVKGGNLDLLNSPSLPPQKIFSFASIFELPHLDYEVQFFPHRWKKHPFHASDLVRYLIGQFPAWPPDDWNSNTSNETIRLLGPLIIESFVSETRKMGAIPMVVYLPNATDYKTSDRRALTTQTIDALSRKGIAVVSVKDCLGSKVPLGELTMPGGHYTGKGNHAVAQCLAPTIMAQR